MENHYDPQETKTWFRGRIHIHTDRILDDIEISVSRLLPFGFDIGYHGSIFVNTSIQTLVKELPLENPRHKAH